MTGLQKDILEIILESQLQIETAVLEKLEDPMGMNESEKALKSITLAKINEIKKQIAFLKPKEEEAS